MPHPEKSVAEVVLDKVVLKTLDYAIPASLATICVGTRVEVKVRNSIQKGYVVALKNSSSCTQLSPIEKIVPGSIPTNLVKLLIWVAGYYCTALSKVFFSTISSVVKKDVAKKTFIFLRLATTKKAIIAKLPTMKKKQPAQAKILEYFLKTKECYQANLINDIKANTNSIKNLIKEGYLKAEKRNKKISEHILAMDYFSSATKQLNAEQAKALTFLKGKLGQFSTTLLFGVTGSGKTEIYMQLITESLNRDKNVIILVPEVTLTTHLIEKFKSRFDTMIAIIHHKRLATARQTEWKAILDNRVKIIIGARSAIFAPLSNIGCIIVDEEHDASYKQKAEMPTYNARDVAIMRAKIENCPIVLGSATPSLESYHNALKGKYHLLELKKRINTTLPKITICNMQNSRGYLSPPLIDGIIERHKNGEQVILFFNRRGYHTKRACSNCLQDTLCPKCDVSLIYHKTASKLLCHLCDYEMLSKTACSNCKAIAFTYKGIGTQHIEKTLKKLFPELHVLRLDRDSTLKRGACEDIFIQFNSGKADILVGTQMVAKGLDFPAVTLVGIINLDAMLYFPHFRAQEQLFQTIIQVAGRAGRRHKAGSVILQTTHPTHPTIIHAVRGDYEPFYENEIAERKSYLFPPFVRLLRVEVAAKNRVKAQQAIFTIYKKLLALQETQAMQPKESYYAKINEWYRFEMLCKTRSMSRLATDITKHNIIPPYNRHLKVLFDIDHSS